MLEDDTLLGILQTITLCLVLIITFKSLDCDVVSEGVIKGLHALHIKLNVYLHMSISFEYTPLKRKINEPLNSSIRADS